MVLQSVIERIGVAVETLGSEVVGVLGVVQRNPGTTTAVVAVGLGILIVLALSTR